MTREKIAICQFVIGNGRHHPALGVHLPLSLMQKR